MPSSISPNAVVGHMLPNLLRNACGVQSILTVTAVDREMFLAHFTILEL